MHNEKRGTQTGPGKVSHSNRTQYPLRFPYSLLTLFALGILNEKLEGKKVKPNTPHSPRVYAPGSHLGIKKICLSKMSN